MKTIDYIFRYRQESAYCRVRIYKDSQGGPATVLLTEVPANPGMNITGASAAIATSLAACWNLNLQTTIWIEHYPPTAWQDKEIFNEIRYKWDAHQTARQPRWRRRMVEEVERTTGDTSITENGLC